MASLKGEYRLRFLLMKNNDALSAEMNVVGPFAVSAHDMAYSF